MEAMEVAPVDESGNMIHLSPKAPTTTDIDCMIYASTFLIDKLYIETYVSDSNEDNAALVKAVQFGRSAGQKSKERYDSFHAKQTTSNDVVNEKGWIQEDDSLVDPTDPHPPTTSLFADDADDAMQCGILVCTLASP